MISPAVVLFKSTLPVLWLISSAVLSPGFSQDPDPQCYDRREVLAACYSRLDNCFHECAGEDPAWTLVREGESGPVPAYQGNYIFLDPTKLNGQPRLMTTSIAPGNKAICFEFRYIATGNTSVPINIYIGNGDRFSLVHQADTNTGGSWESTQFSCCLPHVNTERRIAVETISTEDSIVAIDQLDILMSDMPCENGKLTCYPSPPFQPPLDPLPAAPACPTHHAIISDALSCEFSSHDRNRTDTCGWQVSSGCQVRQKIDGSGYYDTLYANENRGISLLSVPTQERGVSCIEIQFTMENVSADLSKVFSVAIVDKEEILFSGDAYNYRGSAWTVWKRNVFSVCVSQKRHWQILIIVKAKGLQIDYVRTRTSKITCGPATPMPKEISLVEMPKVLSTSARPKLLEDLLTKTERQAEAASERRQWGITLTTIILVLALGLIVSLGALAWECRNRSSSSWRIHLGRGLPHNSPELDPVLCQTPSLRY